MVSFYLSDMKNARTLSCAGVVVALSLLGNWKFLAGYWMSKIRLWRIVPF